LVDRLALVGGQGLAQLLQLADYRRIGRGARQPSNWDLPIHRPALALQSRFLGLP